MNKHASDEAVTATVSALSDDRLLERTKELSGVEHHLEVVVIDHLREIQKRRLYLRIGFSSLFDYAVRELGYSDAAAWRRIKAMRLCADVEGVRERLRNGTMTLNAAAQLQNAFDRQERKKERAARSAPGGAGFGAAAQSQEGSAPARPAERKPAAAPVPVLDPEARRELVEQAPAQPGDEAADRPDTSAAKPATDATSAAKTRRLDRPAATACAKSAAAPRTETSAAKAGGLTGRTIPAAVKREVWRRDRAAAATWTAPAGAAAARNTCCRSITSCRMPAAARPSRTISGCCAPPITATATSAPDSAFPARISGAGRPVIKKPVIKIAENVILR